MRIRLGKYVLITDDLDLDASSMMRIYKSTGVIEQEFHVLKSELLIDSVFHWKPERIQVHFSLILWGMMALAMLRQELAKKGMDYTFEELMEKIKEGQVSEGDYIYPGKTSYRIRKALNIDKKLTDIFRALKIKWDYFDIETIDPGVAESTLTPTENEQIGSGKITMEAKSGKNMQDMDESNEIKPEI